MIAKNNKCTDQEQAELDFWYCFQKETQKIMTRK